MTLESAQRHVERVIEHRHPTTPYSVLCDSVTFGEYAHCSVKWGFCSDNDVGVDQGKRHLRVTGLDCSAALATVKASTVSIPWRIIGLVAAGLVGLLVLFVWIGSIVAAFSEGKVGQGVLLIALPAVLPLVAVGWLLWVIFSSGAAGEFANEVATTRTGRKVDVYQDGKKVGTGVERKWDL